MAAALWRPDGWPGFVVFIAQAAVVGSATALLSDRAARRLLPLADLLNMTIVFPDRAPSRFGLALRSGTIRQLRGSLQAGDLVWPADQQRAAEQLIAIVGSLGSHDRLTRGHTERVRAYADLIGEELGLSPHDREMLHWAAMAHDVGKLTVPAEILSGEGQTTDEEWAILKQHPAAGGEMLEPLAPWLGTWRLAASQHHERWDGAGYPAGLAGTDIDIAGRIVAVADAFDVITSNRSYKKAMSPEAGRHEIVRCSGTQFDPDVVRALLNVSLTKERTAIGFLGWFAELGGLSAAPRAAGQALAATTTAAAIIVGAVAADARPTEELIVTTSGTTTTQLALDTPTSLPYVDQADEAPPSSATDPTRREPEVAPDPVDEQPDTTPLPSTTTTSGPTETEPPATAEPTTATTAPTPTTAPAPTTTAPTTAAPTTTASTTTTTAAPTTTTTAPTTTTSAPTTTTTAPTTTTTTPGSPLAVTDDVTVEEDKNIRIYVLDNDDPGNSALDEGSLEIITDPQHAKDFRVHNDHIHYRSVKDYVGSDSMEYRICNLNGLCDTITITITVTP